MFPRIAGGIYFFVVVRFMATYFKASVKIESNIINVIRRLASIVFVILDESVASHRSHPHSEGDDCTNKSIHHSHKQPLNCIPSRLYSWKRMVSFHWCQFEKPQGKILIGL